MTATKTINNIRHIPTELNYFTQKTTETQRSNKCIKNNDFNITCMEFINNNSSNITGF